MNARVVHPAAGRIELEDVLVNVEKGTIEAVGPPGALPPPDARDETLDARGLHLAPGFLDLQVNGGFGVDFARAAPDDVARALRGFAAHGTTGLLATLITAPLPALRAALERLHEAQTQAQGQGQSGLLGAHLEGPFLSPARRGTHPLEHLKEPDVQALDGLLAGLEGVVKLITLAPELPHGLRLIEAARGRGLVVSLGHSDATHAQAIDAFRRGAALVTHLFNAMRPFHHREPGLTGAALLEPVSVGLIVDGVHVHPKAVELVWRLKGPERLILITDAMSATGMGDGLYPLGEVEVRVEGGVARNAEGALAGSLLTLDRALSNLMRFAGASLPEAVRTVTLNPARLLGLDDRGAVRAGRRADLVLFEVDGATHDLRVRYTLQGGRVIHER